MKTIPLLSLLLFFSMPVSAYFTMELKSWTDDVALENETYVNFTVVNVGNEPAFNVIIELMENAALTGARISIGVLSPNRPFNGSFRTGFARQLLPGTYPAIIKLYYTDRNTYPFNVIFPEVVNYKTKKTPKVLTNLGETTIYPDSNRYTDLKIDVINYDTKLHNVSVRLYLPAELSATSVDHAITVPAGVKKTVTVGITSSAALPSSSYSIIAVSNYEDEGVHYSRMGLGRVYVTTPPLTAIPNPVFMLVLGGCVIVIAIIVIRIVKNSKERTKIPHEGEHVVAARPTEKAPVRYKRKKVKN